MGPQPQAPHLKGFHALQDQLDHVLAAAAPSFTEAAVMIGSTKRSPRLWTTFAALKVGKHGGVGRI